MFCGCLAASSCSVLKLRYGVTKNEDPCPIEALLLGAVVGRRLALASMKAEAERAPVGSD